MAFQQVRHTLTSAHPNGDG